MKKWLLLCLIALGCNPKIVSYLNEKAPFDQFETYRLVSAKSDSKNITPENTQIFDLIKKNIHDQMSERSYQLSNVTPDLILRYEVLASTRVENNVNNPNRFYSPFQVNSRTIYESSLLLELLDQNKKLVWQGSYDLKQEKKEKKASRAIEKAVGYIFTTFPYKALSNQTFDELKTLNE